MDLKCFTNEETEFMLDQLREAGVEAEHTLSSRNETV